MVKKAVFTLFISGFSFILLGLLLIILSQFSSQKIKNHGVFLFWLGVTGFISATGLSLKIKVVQPAESTDSISGNQNN